MTLNVSVQKNLTLYYLDCIEYNGFKLENIEPTTITPTSTTCLDHFITKNLVGAEVQDHDNLLLTDHTTLILSIRLESNTSNIDYSFRDTKFLTYTAQIFDFNKSLSIALQEMEET